MRIASVELIRLELELVSPLVTSAGTHHSRPVVLVQIETDEATGIGECAALEDPTYTEEYADGAELVLRDRLVPHLLANGGRYDDAVAASAALNAVRGHSMAKAALEMALLDAELRSRGESLAHRLGASALSIPAGATVGIDAPGRVVENAATLVALGYRRLKIKVAPGHDLAALQAVREAFPELSLAADANGSYDASDRAHLAALREIDALGLTYLEQPCAADDLVGHVRLRSALETPVVLDESIRSVGDVATALELGACDGVSVKPARLGGVLIALRVHDRCVDAGLHLVIGGMLESSVGRAAAIAVGALAGFDLPGDLGASDRYFARDLSAPFELVDGALVVPVDPGIGVELDRSFLESQAVRNTVLEAS